MTHVTPGVIVFPGATGSVDFPGVANDYIIAFSGTIQGMAVSWERLPDGGLRVYGTNTTRRTILLIPLVRDTQ